jgi:hypothetical protein
MPKKQPFQFLPLSCLLLVASFLLGACLNPINFDGNDLPTLNVNVSGEIKIADVAVMWLINRSKSVDVTSFKIEQPKDSAYPKTYSNKPLAGTSFATYHTPRDGTAPYTVTVSWNDNGTPDSWSSEVQFPRAADYKFYLYRTKADKIIVVNENEMTELSDPDDTVPSLDPPGFGDEGNADVQTFVVFNLTPDQDIGEVEFKDSKNNSFAMSGEPKARDQKMILLESGSYSAVVSYTKDGTPKATVEKNVTVAKEAGSMAVRTNFLYFYKTKAGDYKTSPTWSPVPTDASDENNVQTFVVVNLTQDQNIDKVEFTSIKGEFTMTGAPKASDQQSILLETGSYSAVISYTKDGTAKTTAEKNVTVTTGSMAAQTNFLYFYKTKTGDYQTSPTWSPVPEDASDEKTAQTFVVINVTPDQNVDKVEFAKDGSSFAITGEPRAKDQKMILLAPGSYDTVAHYTQGGTAKATAKKNIVVTQETGSMAVRTNFVYFYKTKSGDYQLSQTWPPIPDDASDGNKPEDALQEGQGILRIVNKAVSGQPHSLIARVKINNQEYPDATNSNPYMISGDARMYILDAGTVYVSFKPTDQNTYGMTIPREILSRQITTLEYTGDLANPDVIPPDEGYGAGLIRITNNSEGIVYGVTIFQRNDLSKSMIMDYESFTPPQIIHYGQVGRVPVIGNEAFPLRTGEVQLVQVDLEFAEGPVTIERLASLNGLIFDIVISQDNLAENKRFGSLVTVENTTTVPTVVTLMEVYNRDNPSVYQSHGLNVPNTSGSNREELYVLSGTGFPIMDGEDYRANLTVYHNGLRASITKDFSPDNRLYSTSPASHKRTITLTDADLPSDWSFTPITGISIQGSLGITVSTTNGTDLTQTSTLDFGAVSLEFSPSNASIISPVAWTEAADSKNLVTIASNILTVAGVPADLVPNGTATETVTVKATIAGAGAGGAAYSKDFPVTITYVDFTVTAKPVTEIKLGTPGNIQIGETLNLLPLASFDPPDPRLSNGTPITVSQLTWTVVSGTAGSISGSVFSATAAGTVTIQATLPAAANGGTAITKTMMVIVDPPLFTAINDISAQGSLALTAYTNNLILTTSTFDFNGVTLVFNPANASKKSPVVWTEKTDTESLVSIASNVLTVTGVPAALVVNGTVPKTVTVTATIAGGGAGGAAYSKDFLVTITYSDLTAPNAKPVTAINLGTPGHIQIGEPLNLAPLASFTPPDAHLANGTPITVNQLTWTIVGGTGGSISVSAFSATAAGTFKVRATLAAAVNDGTAKTEDMTVIVDPPPFTPISDISVQGSLALTAYTTNGTTLTSTSTFNLNGVSLVFDPANATVRSPVAWTEDTDTGNLVTIASNVLTVTGVPSGLALNATATRTVRAKATIAGGGNGGTAYSKAFDVTITYVDSTAVANPVTEIKLGTPGNIQIGETLNLPPFASFNPLDAHLANGTPITVSQLTWSVTSGTGGSISGTPAVFSATAAGTFTVQATLAANANAGTERTATMTVVVDPPPTPTSFTLRVILENKKDSVKQIALVPMKAAADGWTAASRSPHASSRTVYESGYTGYGWATGYTYDPTFTTLNRFATRWPVGTYGTFYKTVDIPKGVGNYRDVEIPWPASGYNGYCLFFLEGDNRARGYCYPGTATAPTKDKNFLFYLRADAMKPIWLDAYHYERAPNTPGAKLVVPVTYHTDDNVAAMMRSAGIGKIPTYYRFY